MKWPVIHMAFQPRYFFKFLPKFFLHHKKYLYFSYLIFFILFSPPRDFFSHLSSFFFSFSFLFFPPANSLPHFSIYHTTTILPFHRCFPRPDFGKLTLLIALTVSPAIGEAYYSCKSLWSAFSLLQKVETAAFAVAFLSSANACSP